MKPLLLILLLGAASIASRALASREAAIAMDEVILSSKELGIQVQVTETEKERPAVQVTFKGKTTKVDDYFLFEAKKIIKSSVRVIVHFGGPTDTANDAIADGRFIVSFEYGGHAEHGDKAKGEVVRVHPVLRLHFSPGGSMWSEPAKPKGDFSNVWQILDRRKIGEKPDDSELVLRGVTCPFSSSVE